MIMRKPGMNCYNYGIIMSSTNTARVITYTAFDLDMCHVKGTFMYIDDEQDMIFNTSIIIKDAFNYLLKNGRR